MADYEIVTQIVAKDAVDPATRSAEDKLDRVERKGESVGRSITSSLGRAFALIGGSAIIGRATRSIIGLQSEIETAQASMASLFTATFGLSMAQGIGLARSELQGLKADAATGVGELSNYLEAYQLLLSPVTAAGGNLDDVRRFTGQALAAGFALRGQAGLDMAPLDITQALQQGANDKITPIAAAALRAAGLTTEAFNKLDTAGRMDALSAAFEKFAPAVELMGKTWEAQAATFVDGVRGIIRAVSEPIFDRWKSSLQAANNWLESNQGQVERITRTVGESMVRAWDHVVANARTYLVLLTAAAAVQQSSMLREGLGGFVKSRGAAAVSAGGGLLSAIRDPLGMQRVVTGGMAAAGLGGAATGGAGIGSALGTLGSALVSLAGPALLVAAAFLGVQGAWAEFPQIAALVREGLAMLREEGAALMTAIGGLIGAFGGLRAEGSVLNIVGAGLLLVLAAMINGVTTLTEVLTFAVNVLAAFVDIIVGLARGIGLSMQGRSYAGAQALREGLESASGRFSTTGSGSGSPTGFLGSLSDMRGNLAEGVDRLKIDAALKNAMQPAPTVNIGKVEVAVKAEVNEDPARVALAMGEVFGQINRYRRSALREA